jgi:Bacterial SH3 domain
VHNQTGRGFEMTTGKVIPDPVNIRATPGGIKLGTLPKGTSVTIMGVQADWFEIRFNGAVAFVKAELIALDPDPPTPVPPEMQPGDIVLRDGRAFAAGTSFGKLFRLGIANSGATSMGSFIAASPALFATLPASLVRIARAVSVNEGRLEAINTWDNAFLSFGIFQWTCGPDVAEGELPALLQRLKNADAAAFKRYFGKYGLDVQAASEQPGKLWTGSFVLNGSKLVSPAQKEAMRAPIWAYRFWRAGHDRIVRKAQIDHALARIKAFYDLPSPLLHGLPLRRWISSEAGVAQLLDQHVNRPGHVPKTIASAIDTQIAATGKSDPAKWQDGDETAALKRYIAVRESTSMTDSTPRAKRINDAVTRGELSVKRGSFKDR